MWIFAALVAIPIIEIALFIELGGWVGLWPTIGLVIVTAILGAALLRAQGFAAMTRLQQSVAEGGNPSGPLAHGVMILIAGLLMLTPGFFTDAVGFLLLIPPVRSAIIAWAGPRIAKRAVYMGPGMQGGRRPPQHDGPIEADYEDLTDVETPPPAGGGKANGSGWTKPPERLD
ncbi:MAG: FxsA family protein [Pseudomonadota bacterium]